MSWYTDLIAPERRPRRDDYTYAIEFSDGVVKVGRTIDPAARFKTHHREARRLGVRATRWCLSVGGPNARPDERLLIAFCKERWPLAQGLEYFAGADYDLISEYLLDLDDIQIAKWQASGTYAA